MTVVNRIALFALAAGVPVLPLRAAAQDVTPPGFGFGVSGSVISISPEENKREWGGTGNAFLQYTWASGLQVVGGASYGGVSAQEVASLTVSGTRKVFSVFGDVRLILNTRARSAAPYVGAHIAYLDHSLSTTLAGGDLEVSGTGWNYAGIFGVYLRLTDKLAADFSLTFGLAPFSDPDATLDGEALDLKGGTTYTGSLGAGLVYSLGG
jgi:hypothetical protein